MNKFKEFIELTNKIKLKIIELDLQLNNYILILTI